MAGTTERIAIKRNTDEDIFVQYTETFAAPGQTNPLKYQRSEDGVHLQISGSATACNIVVERCTNDPNGGNSNWAPAMPDAITGNLALGIAPLRFIEPSRGFWRVRVVSISGGNAIVAISGEQA